LCHCQWSSFIYLTVDAIVFDKDKTYSCVRKLTPDRYHVQKKFPPKKTGVQAIASVLMTIVGMFIGGASNMIGAACAADLGKAAIELGMSSAVATVTGIIDGTGSVGAAVGQIAIPVMEEDIGWDSVFVMFMVMSGLSALALIPVVYRELKNTIFCRCFHRSSQPSELGMPYFGQNGASSKIELPILPRFGGKHSSAGVELRRFV